MATRDLCPSVEHPVRSDQARARLEAEVKVPAGGWTSYVSSKQRDVLQGAGAHVVNAALDAFAAGAQVVRRLGRAQAACVAYTGSLQGFI